MYNRLSDEKNESVNMQFDKVVLKRDFSIMNAGESMYDFLGDNSRLRFTQLIHPDYEKEFLDVCGMIKDDEDYRVITLLRDHDGIYHTVNIHIGLSRLEPDAEQVYMLDIYSVDGIEYTYLEAYQKLDKYRMFMDMAGIVYMEYWPETGRMVFYNYIAMRAHILYEKHIDVWHEDAVKYGLDVGSNIADIDQMYEKLKNLASQFTTTIKTGILNHNRIKETLDIEARYINRHNMEIIAGIVQRRSITDDGVPYYLTPAGKDPMTGLLNKRAIIEYTNDCLAVGDNNKFYMILIDIDDFKHINDTYGHLMGDRAITVLAESLLESLNGRGIVGRFGGDEFFALTEEIKNESQLRLFLKAFLSKLRLSQAEKLEGIKYTLSMGISQYPEAGYNFRNLFAIADKALYIAKDKGKNRYIIYRPEMHDSIDVTGVHSDTNVSGRQAKMTKKAVRSLALGGRGALDEVLQNIKDAFDFESIIIRYGNNLDQKIMLGDCPPTLAETLFLKPAEYSDIVFEDNIFAANAITNVEKADEKLYKKLLEEQCGAFVQVVLPTNVEPESAITFVCKEKRHKWSEAEVNYLDILANLIYSVIK